MSVTSYRVTQYIIRCDFCGKEEVCADSMAEDVHSKRAAVKWAGMKMTKCGVVVCKDCLVKTEQRCGTKLDGGVTDD
jgi:hypothetical protein